MVAEYSEQDDIGFKECTFSWEPFGMDDSQILVPSKGREQFKLRFDGEVIFKRGLINIIVGPTASGKVL